MSKIAEFHEAVTKACTTALTKGMVLCRKSSGDGKRDCCPMFAVTDFQTGSDMIVAAAQKLGVTEDEVWSFVEGWDGFSRGFYRGHDHGNGLDHQLYEDYYLLGQAFFAEFASEVQS